MDESRIRQAIAEELRYQHNELVLAKRKERQIRADLDRLYDRTFWDTHRTHEEWRARSDQQDEANRLWTVTRVEITVRESAVWSLRGVADALKPRRY